MKRIFISDKLLSHLPVVLLGAIALSLLVFEGCSKSQTPVPAPSASTPTTSPSRCYTGVVITKSQLTNALQNPPFPPVIFQSANYAVVNSAWIPGFMEVFRAELFSKGVVDNAQSGSGWVKQFDCLFFTDAFEVLAEEEYTRESFHDFVVAPSLAIVKVNYKRDTDIRAGDTDGHSIVVILTEKGLVYLDPQIGPITLSPTEINSIFFRLAH